MKRALLAVLKTLIFGAGLYFSFFLFAGHFKLLPDMDDFLTSEAGTLYLFDLKTLSKASLFSGSKMRNVRELFFDADTNHVYFSSEYFDSAQTLRVLKDLDLNNKAVAKVVNAYDTNRESYGNMFIHVGSLLLLKTTSNSEMLVRYKERNQEENVYTFPEGIAPSFLLPADEDTFLFSSLKGNREKGVTLIGKIENRKLTILAQYKGIGRLLNARWNGKFYFFVIQCEQFPLDGCNVHYYTYSKEDDKIRQVAIVPRSKEMDLALVGLTVEDNLIFLNKKKNTLDVYDKSSEKLKTYYKFSQFPPTQVTLGDEVYGNGQSFVFSVQYQPVDDSPRKFLSRKNLYVFNIKEKKLINVERNTGTKQVLSSVSWNPTGDKLVYVVE